MAYRRTDNVVRRLAAREQTILDAAQSIAAESGMGAVQILPVAQRADIAAGTVYRYFPSKNDLIAELIAAAAARELTAMRAAAEAAPGPLSALAACIAIFAARALQDRQLAWAVMAEPVDAAIDALRLEFRRALGAELEARINTAIAGRHLPDQDARMAAPAIVGAVLEGLISRWHQPAALAGSAGDALLARERLVSSMRGRATRRSMRAAITLLVGGQRRQLVKRQGNDFDSGFA